MESGLAKEGNTQSLDFYVEKRNGKKRNYIFDYGKSRSCSHGTLKEIAKGGNWYRCLDCNYAFFIESATQWPLHFLPIMGAFQLMGFAKEFGMDSLQEVLRRPIGQTDGTAHKPVLPEGMSFMDALAALEDVDVNAEDGGAAQLKALMASLWEKGIPVLSNGDSREEIDDGSSNEGNMPALSP